jgi:hypothetical protein
MSVIETVLIYGVIPLAVFLAFAAATLIPGRSEGRTKYRPGQPWTADPVWYEPHPGAGGGHGADPHADDHAGHGVGATAALTAGGHDGSHPEAPRRTAAGGARGTW